MLPIVTVTGNPGVGKTTFAIRGGHRLASAFPDGQLFVNLRGADLRPRAPEEVLARFLRDLGVSGVDVPTSREERVGMFRDRLTPRRMLIVLDNAAAEEQVRPLLPGHPGCCVLITSRSRLTGLDTSKRIRLSALEIRRMPCGCSTSSRATAPSRTQRHGASLSCVAACH